MHLVDWTNAAGMIEIDSEATDLLWETPPLAQFTATSRLADRIAAPQSQIYCRLEHLSRDLDAAYLQIRQRLADARAAA